MKRAKFGLLFVLALSLTAASVSFAQDSKEEDVPAEAPSKKKDDRPTSFRRKDIDFEDRTIEGIKKPSLDAEGLLKSDRKHPDLHKKRQHYKVEISERMKDLEYLR